MPYRTFEPTPLRYKSVGLIPAKRPIVDRDVARCSALGGGERCKAFLPDFQKLPEFFKACKAFIIFKAYDG